MTGTGDQDDVTGMGDQDDVMGMGTRLTQQGHQGPGQVDVTGRTRTRMTQWGQQGPGVMNHECAGKDMDHRKDQIQLSSTGKQHGNMH